MKRCKLKITVVYKDEVCDKMCFKSGALVKLVGSEFQR